MIHYNTFAFIFISYVNIIIKKPFPCRETVFQFNLNNDYFLIILMNCEALAVTIRTT